MDSIVACPDPERLEALCAFADHLATLTDPRDRRGLCHPLPVLLATLLVALAGGANSMAAVAAFTHDHRTWFRLWLSLGTAAPSRDTYLRLVRRLDPETAVKAALWRLDGTSLPGPGNWSWPWTARWPAARATGRRYAGPASGERLPGAGGVDPGPGAVCGQEQ